MNFGGKMQNGMVLDVKSNERNHAIPQTIYILRAYKPIGCEIEMKYPELDKDTLYRMYWMKRKSTREIGEEIGCNHTTVWRRMKNFGIIMRGLSEANTGEKNHNYGKHRSAETIRKISEAHTGTHHTEETRRKLAEINTGRHHTEETRRKISEAETGKKHYNWQGGVSYAPYCPKFNNQLKEKIREKYGKVCFLCGKTEGENGERLSVHHIDGDKMQGCNGKQWSLVPLCHSCHSKVQHDKNRKLNNELLFKLVQIDNCMLHPQQLVCGHDFEDEGEKSE